MSRGRCAWAGSDPIYIAYHDVWRVQQNLSRGAKIAIAAGVILTVVIIGLTRPWEVWD